MSASPPLSTPSSISDIKLVVSEVPLHPPFSADQIPAEWPSTLKDYKNYESSWQKWENFHPDIQRILARPRIPSGIPRWNEERRLRLTATNLGSVLRGTSLRGKNPYVNRYKLFLVKTGRSDEGATSMNDFNKKAIEHGHHYEAEAARFYSEATGIDLVEEDIGMLFHQKEECIAATPDRIAKYFPINIEIKCPYRRKIEHFIPDMYYSQVQQQMAVLNLQETHFVQYRPQEQLDIVVVKFDPEWWQAALGESLSFWQEVVDFYAAAQKPIGSMLVDWTPPDKRKFKRTLDCSTGEIIEEQQRPKRAKPSIVPKTCCILNVDED